MSVKKWKIKRDGEEYSLLSCLNSEKTIVEKTDGLYSQLSKENCEALFKDEESDEIFVTCTYEKNQCDGCKAGHDVSDLGIHVYPNSTRGYMVCQKHLYKPVYTKI